MTPDYNKLIFQVDNYRLVYVEGFQLYYPIIYCPCNNIFYYGHFQERSEIQTNCRKHTIQDIPDNILIAFKLLST